MADSLKLVDEPLNSQKEALKRDDDEMGKQIKRMELETGKAIVPVSDNKHQNDNDANLETNKSDDHDSNKHDGDDVNHQTILTTNIMKEQSTTLATKLIKNCDNCMRFQIDLEQAKADKIDLEKQLSALKKRIQTINGELEKEVQKRWEMEQKFTEEAKRSTDQISELIAKSNQDDARLSEINRKFDLHSRETSAMIESFTTNRDLLTSQLIGLREENDYLLGKYIGKSRDLQNEEINLPQSVDELQYHCLKINEKLILATLAKEELEETLMKHTTQ